MTERPQRHEVSLRDAVEMFCFPVVASLRYRGDSHRLKRHLSLPGIREVDAHILLMWQQHLPTKNPLLYATETAVSLVTNICSSLYSTVGS